MSEMLEGFIRAVEATGSKVRRHGKSMAAQCPAHDDGSPSLSFSMGDDGVIFKCHAGCKKADILQAIDLTWPDVFNNKGKRGKSSSSDEDLWMPCKLDGCDGHKVAEYEYPDEEGKVLYVVARCSRKGQGCQGFRQWVPDPDKRYGKSWSIPEETRRVPYDLPTVLKAAKAGRRIFLMEGEKDAERLMDDYPGEIATTMAGGAGEGKWKAEYCKYFRGAAEVIIVADCDDAGLIHAEEVHRHMSKVVTKVKAVCSSLMSDGADFSDHRDYDLGLDELETIPFEPVKRRPRMVIEVEEVDRKKGLGFTGFSQTSVERSLVGSMLKFGHGYSVAPIDIVSDPKLKVAVKAIAQLANQGRTVSPEMVALEIEAGSSGSYDKIYTDLLKIEELAFSDTEKPKIAARILRQRTIRTHVAAWLNAVLRRLSNETIDLEDILREMRVGLERHAEEYVDLGVLSEPVADVFSGDVIQEVEKDVEEELILEEEEKSTVTVLPMRRSGAAFGQKRVASRG